MKDKHYYEQQATEEEFLEWYKQSDHPQYEKPSLTVDNVILSVDEESQSLHLLLIKRKAHPFKDHWALPGGFVSSDESTSEACIRETAEETGVKLTTDNIEQLYTFSKPGRDPRTWVVSTAYLSFLPQCPTLEHGDDAKEAVWATVHRNKENQIVLQIGAKQSIIDTVTHEQTGDFQLAFDHAKIIEMAITRLGNKLNYEPKVLQVLGYSFTLKEAWNLFYQLDPTISSDPGNLSKTHADFIEQVDYRSEGRGRPSRLYRLKD